MSNEQPAPLWSDENIANDAKRASSSPTTQATIRSCLLFMRYGYEADRQRLKQANAELAAEVERLSIRLELQELRLAHEAILAKSRSAGASDIVLDSHDSCSTG